MKGGSSCRGLSRWLGVLLLFVLCETNAKPNTNIILIMTDDQGRWSLGEYDQRIQTPNIDHLAKEGVRFDQAISSTPVCSAARASLYTGKTASQHGVHDFLSDEYSDGGEWLAGETLISEILSDQGYRVGLFGKWHATTQGWKPVRGFNRWLTYDERAANWINQYQHSGTVYFSSDGEGISHSGVQARFLSESAVDFIDSADGQPFAAFVNFVEPHFPFAGLPERLVQRYRMVARDIVASGDWSSLAASGRVGPDPGEHEEKLAQYLAAVTLVDDQVGRIVDALMGRGLLDSTIIIFTSDHGHLTGQYGIYGKGNATLPQNFYEESINIPLVIYGPTDLVAPAQVRNEFVSLYDLFPTLVELSGAGKTLVDYSGPGKSLLPLLKGSRPVEFRDFHYAEMGNGRMVHNGRWKLVRYYERGGSYQDHWFDLVHPLGERRPSPAPSKNQQSQLVTALDLFFQEYEIADKSGKNIWDLPIHNSMEAWRVEQ